MLRNARDAEHIIGQFADLVAALRSWDRQGAVVALETLRVFGLEIGFGFPPFREVVGEIDPLLDTSVHRLDGVRQPAIDALRQRDVRLVRVLIEKTPDELRAIPGLGEGGVRQIVAGLAKLGLALKAPAEIRATFPAARERLRAIRAGKATGGVVPLDPGRRLERGDHVAFVADDGPDGGRATVVLTAVRDGHLAIDGKALVYLEWRRPSGA